MAMVWGQAIKNWGQFGGILGKAAWKTRTGRAAIGGAALGAGYGLFASDSSLLGGAFRGAATGALLGSARGWGLASTLGGATINTVMGGSPFWGALGGRGAYLGARSLRGIGSKALEGYKVSRGMGRMPAMRVAGRAAYEEVYGQAMAAKRFIGRTMRKTVNPIRSMANLGF